MRAGQGVIGEWTSEGGPKGGGEGMTGCREPVDFQSGQVGTDGHPTRYPSGCVWMVRESEWTCNVNLGGIAGAEAFVPCVGKGFFYAHAGAKEACCGDDASAAQAKLLYPFRFGEAGRPSAARITANGFAVCHNSS